jgi:GNAT superfamily N-acetyltransferase
MPDDPRSRITEQEESELMPRSAPRSNARDRDERALALLQGQVDALGHDIATARALAHRSPEGLGSPLRGHREADAPRLHGERVRLPDGGEIVIRAIEPRDVRDLRAGFERLSAVSRYRRFLTEIDHLTPHQLDYLTHVDHTDHEALVAVAVATGEGVGTARFVRDPGDGTTAEVAVVVADDWQGRGVGSALLERLAARARATGIERFSARMIAGNECARRLLAHLGDVVGERRNADSIELKLRLR